MRVMLNVTRQYFKIIAWYFIDEHTSVLDSNSLRIRKVSTFDLIYYITHLDYRAYRPTRINRITKPIRWRLSNGRFPMERRDHCLRYLRQRICGTLPSLQRFRENFNLRGQQCIAKRMSVPNMRGHFEAIERPELTEFAAALYVAFSTKSEAIQIPTYIHIYTGNRTYNFI